MSSATLPAADSGISFTRQLARDLRAREFSLEDEQKAKLCIIDVLACAFAGIDLPWSRQAVKLARANAADGTCGIIGHAANATALDAAFANAVICHSLVRDDMHLGSVSHLGAPVIAASLTLAEQQRPSGRAFLQAVAAGYEAGGVLGRAVLDVEVSRIHRPTGITGPFAAAAAGARMCELDEDSMTSALGLAANTAGGYNEWATTGGMEMFFHAGFAVRNALTALTLAEAGAFISPTAVDGRAGLLAAFGKSAPVRAGHDDRAEIQHVFFKEVPACNFAQSSAQAAKTIAGRERLAAADVARVVARVNYAAANYPGCDCAGPFTQILQAKMSIQYNVAAALIKGTFAEDNYVPRRQPRICELAQRVQVSIDDTLTARFPAQQSAIVEVHLADGRTLVEEAVDVAPASPDLVRARFQDAATQHLGRKRAAEIIELIDSLEHAPDASVLVDLCRLESR
jgi:2-methylcitrate dehydratase PrpD